MENNLLNMDVISNYNKFLSGSVQKFDNEINNAQPIEDFEKILNSKQKDFADIEQFNYKNIEVVAPTEKTVSDNMIENFTNSLKSGLTALNDTQLQAQRATELFATGGDIDIHEVMIAAEKANVSMQLALQMRNKAISFYNELKNLNF